MAQQTTFEGPGDEIFTLKFALWANEQILDNKGQILDPIVGFGFLMWMYMSSRHKYVHCRYGNNPLASAARLLSREGLIKL